MISPGAPSRPSKSPVGDREPRLKNNIALRTFLFNSWTRVSAVRLLSSIHTPGAISGVSYPLRLYFFDSSPHKSAFGRTRLFNVRHSQKRCA